MWPPGALHLKFPRCGEASAAARRARGVWLQRVRGCGATIEHGPLRRISVVRPGDTRQPRTSRSFPAPIGSRTQFVPAVARGLGLADDRVVQLPGSARTATDVESHQREARRVRQPSRPRRMVAAGRVRQLALSETRRILLATPPSLEAPNSSARGSERCFGSNPTS